MNKIKRYDISIEYHLTPKEWETICPVESDTGDWVRWKEAEKLQQEKKELLKALINSIEYSCEHCIGPSKWETTCIPHHKNCTKLKLKVALVERITGKKWEEISNEL